MKRLHVVACPDCHETSPVLKSGRDALAWELAHRCDPAARVRVTLQKARARLAAMPPDMFAPAHCAELLQALDAHRAHVLAAAS